jgi:hypothetical protein
VLLQQQPVIVRLYSPPANSSGLQDLKNVLLGSLGLTGALLLVGLVLGVVVGSVLFLMRSQRPKD